MELLLKTILVLVLSGMFLHGLYAIMQGRVYCKGRWYHKTQSAWFWPLVVSYVLGSPLIAYLALTAVWRV
jgi:hypothetical protein